MLDIVYVVVEKCFGLVLRKKHKFDFYYLRVDIYIYNMYIIFTIIMYIHIFQI